MDLTVDQMENSDLPEFTAILLKVWSALLELP